MLETRELTLDAAEEALPLMAAALECGVGCWSIDSAGVFHADALACSIWGRSEDELADRAAGAPACFVQAEDRAQLEALLARERPAAECTVRVPQPDGSVRWLLCRRSPHGVGIVLDVSELRRSEDVRQRSRSQEVVATLAARLAHDFNNLLFAILGNATLALGTSPPGDQHPLRESLREIQRAAERASDIVHRLSAFARPVQPRRQRVALSGPIEAALAALRPNIGPAVRIAWRKPTPEPLVSGDAKLLQDLIANLLTNGVQAMEQQGGELSIEVEAIALGGSEPFLHNLALAPGRYVELRVRDRGVGMERTTAERAFEPFFSTRPKGMGMGLGLSIAQGIATTHGGGVRIETGPGAGTTVHAYLPQL